MTSETHRVPGRRCLLPRLIPLLSIAIALMAQPAAAECQFEIQQVQFNYELGRQDLVLETILGCLEFDGLSGRQLIDAYEYLAKAYVALDEFGKAEATVRLLIQRDPAFAAASGDPPFFRRMVDAAKRGDRTVVISSVSKTNESLREAPATVVVVTATEIRRRGYIDLEAVLHDLPGFDISRGNGTIYSNFYQRGYRSAGNDRTLFLVDGVEHNDVWSNIAYLSRQYPLSNIERVEVVYGPASTMYGPNAFVGVINVITRSPESWLEGDQKMAFEAQVGGGAWETRWLDATLAGQAANGNVAYSVTARVFESDEMDLSRYGDWDFDPRVYDDVTYELPDADVAEAKERDKAALGLSLNGGPIGFTNKTDDTAFFAKLRLFGVDLGFQTWRRNEGLNGWYVDTKYSGSENGNTWIPSATFAYLKYERGFGKLGLRIFSQFLRHEVADGSRLNVLQSYANGDLSIVDLEAGVPAFWKETRFRESSRQFRTEVTFVYTHSPRFNLVSGIEVRSSFLQGNYFLVSGPSAPADLPAGVVERETSSDLVGEFFDQLDLGIFAQASFRPAQDWKLVVGGRLDNNTVDPAAGAVLVENEETGELEEITSPGYGTVFNPRLAAIYSPGPFVFKAIYAEAFKDASNFNRYALSPGTRDKAAPDLAVEKVRNFELSAGWQVNDNLQVDLTAYRSEYSNAVVLQEVDFEGGRTLQNTNAGALEILGIQSTLRYTFGDHDLWANYTWTDPKSTNPLDELGQPRELDGVTLDEVRVGDIADHRLNVGFNAALGERLNVNLRLNYVGDRETGERTSVSKNELSVIDAYTVVNASLSYKKVLPGLDLQLVVNNLLDEEYYHPGVRAASGDFAALLPQNERAVFLRGVYGF